MPEDDLEALIVGKEHPIEKSLRDCIEFAVMGFFGRAKKPAAKHRGEAQRDKAGDQDGHPDRDRELVEQPSDNPPHQQDGDKDRDKRKGHGDDREADLLRPVEGGFERSLPHLQMAHDVFQHHDGIVDHEAHGEGEGHQREVVKAVIQKVHHCKGPHDGHGKRQARDQCGGDVAEKQENHQNH